MRSGEREAAEFVEASTEFKRPLEKISIRETSPGTWRVTFNGSVLGDSPGYRKEQAIAAAKAAAARDDCGRWVGNKWVPVTRVFVVEG